MKKITLFLLVIFSLYTTHLSATEQKESDLIKYLDPSIIPKLNWILLITEIEFKKEGIQSDEYKLVKFIDLCTIEYPHSLVGITFIIKKKSYLKLKKKIIEKTFLDLTEEVTEAIKEHIQEIELKRDILAVFIIKEETDYRKIAQYKDGKFLFFDLEKETKSNAFF
ncbi:MAG TPA: hypothetical protein VMW81_07665 [Nitrospinota bacterium]|nr:hypothetical protein [Nitrospinota bacterium]